MNRILYSWGSKKSYFDSSFHDEETCQFLFFFHFCPGDASPATHDKLLRGKSDSGVFSHKFQLQLMADFAI